MPTFESLSLPLLFALFAICAGVVWLAGTRLAGYAGAIADRTGISGALVGVTLLGLITSLPEMATAGTAAIRNNADLAVNNLLGGIAFQVVVIAAADLALRRQALTSTLESPAIMLQAVLSIVMLSLALAATIVGDTAVGGLGIWSWLLVAAYICGIFLLKQAGDEQSWRPAAGASAESGDPVAPALGEDPERQDHSALLLGVLIVAAALAILVAGYLLTRAAEEIAVKTGIGSAMIGVVLLAFATSLPELSSAIGAVRIRKTGLAMGDVFGGNIADVSLIAFADAFYAGPPVLNSVSRSSSLAALLGIVLTAIYLAGMLRRHRSQVVRLGSDSIAVLIVYAIGLVLLWNVSRGVAGSM